MGSWLTKLLKKESEVRIIMIGLDDAGKTTILKQIGVMTDKGNKNHAPNTAIETNPTVGFNVEEVKYKNITFLMWDLGGQDSIRSLWKFYYHGSHGIIFVVDSSDHKRINEAKTQLYKCIEDGSKDGDLDGCPLLIFANKSDKKDAHSAEKIKELFEIEKLVAKDGRHIFVQSTCAVNGSGLMEGMEWFVSEIEDKKRRK